MKKILTALIAVLTLMNISLSQQIKIVDTLNVSAAISNNVILFYTTNNYNYVLFTVRIPEPGINLVIPGSKLTISFRTSSSMNIAAGLDSNLEGTFSSFVTTNILPIGSEMSRIEMNLNGSAGTHYSLKRVGVALSKISNNGFFVLDSISCYNGNGNWVRIYPYPTTAVADDKNYDYDYFLYQNYPNPFNPVTKIRFSIKETNPVKIKLYDIVGREVAVIMNEVKDAGEYEIELDAGKLGISSGVYFYQMKAGDYTSIKKMVYLK